MSIYGAVIMKPRSLYLSPPQVVAARRVPPLTQTLAVAGRSHPWSLPATTGLCHPGLPGCCV
jgi:hypothetical protein